jgi:hypothetical protein
MASGGIAQKDLKVNYLIESVAVKPVFLVLF